MTESEKNDLLIQLSIQTKIIAEVLPPLQESVKGIAEKVIRHDMSLAQGVDRFEHQDEKLAEFKAEVEKTYVRKDLVRAYLIGAATAGGATVAGILKLFGG